MFENPDEKVEFVKLPEALAKARALLGEYKIDEKSFIDLYDRASLIEDLKYVQKLKAEFSLQGKKDYEIVNDNLAEVFEAIIFDEGESANWFGENAALVKTSDYDDLKNGVDAVVEYDQEEGVSRMAMAIDVTFNHDLQKKIDGIKRRIVAGDLATVKYFVSEVSSMRGEISKIPHVIVGADVDTVRELTNMWAAGDRSGMEKHPVQFQFLEEFLSQCVYFADFARKNNQEDVAKAYDSIKKTIAGIKKNKEDKIGADKGTRDSFMNDFQMQFGQ
jgi:hypothetical protein